MSISDSDAARKGDKIGGGTMKRLVLAGVLLSVIVALIAGYSLLLHGPSENPRYQEYPPGHQATVLR